MRSVVVKIPYGGVFAMTELLTRLLYVHELMWFRIDAATTKEINAQKRKGLERWLPAFTRDQDVDWTA